MHDISQFKSSDNPQSTHLQSQKIHQNKNQNRKQSNNKNQL